MEKREIRREKFDAKNRRRKQERMDLGDKAYRELRAARRAVNGCYGRDGLKVNDR